MIPPRIGLFAVVCALVCALPGLADPAPAFLVKDIETAAGHAFHTSTYVSDVGGTVWLTPSYSGIGTEPWTSDGTVAGTRLVTDLNPGVQSSAASVYAKSGGLIYFTASRAGLERGLYRTDGTAAGTSRVMDFFPGAGTGPVGENVLVNGTLYFAARDGVHGTELWKIEDFEAGPVMVKDILPGPGDAIIGFPRLQSANGSVYFMANDGTHGNELWKSDGTEAGTVMVADIWPGGGHSNLEDLTPVGDAVYFVANDGVNGTELWRSDGTSAGTTLVKDLAPSTDPFFRDANLFDLTDVNGVLFFASAPPNTPSAIWRTDGTAAGTILLKTIGDDIPRLTSSGGLLYFVSDDGPNIDDVELWKSDGTPAGTARVADLFPGPFGSDPDWLTDVSGTLFFVAFDGTHGNAVWKTDGTSACTVAVENLGPSGSGMATKPRWLASAGGLLYFGGAGENAVTSS
jgi:ELWxxDGT repeat protein